MEKAKVLLEKAKRSVEIAIEENEAGARRELQVFREKMKDEIN